MPTYPCFASVLVSGGMPDYRSVLDVAVDIARGMRHLHASHIIHADLKVGEEGHATSPQPT